MAIAGDVKVRRDEFFSFRSISQFSTVFFLSTLSFQKKKLTDLDLFSATSPFFSKKRSGTAL